MGLFRKRPAGKVLSSELEEPFEPSRKAATQEDDHAANPPSHHGAKSTELEEDQSQRVQNDGSKLLSVSFSLDSDYLQCMSPSVAHRQRSRDSHATTPTSVLFGDLTDGLPSPMGTLGKDVKANPARGIRMLLDRRREHIPPVSVEPVTYCSISHLVHGEEDTITEPPFSRGETLPFTALGGVTKVISTVQTFDDENQNSLVGSSDCIGTTTGASFGRLTGMISPQSTQSVGDGLFDRQRCSQVGRGLFESQLEYEERTAWDMV